MPTERSGIVLGDATGASVGDGEPALAEFQGEPMLRSVVETVSEVTDDVVVACRADQQDDFAAVLEGLPVRFAVDPEPDLGPVGGLGIALDAVEAPVVVVVAADMPAVDGTFLRYLFDRLGGNEAAVPALPDDRLQPAQAVYRTAPAREAAAESLAAGAGTLADVVDRLQAGIVPPAEVQQVTAWRSLAEVTTIEEGAASEEDEEGPALEEADDAEGTAIEDEGPTFEDEGPTFEDEGPTFEDEGTAIEDEGTAVNNEGGAGQDER